MYSRLRANRKMSSSVSSVSAKATEGSIVEIEDVAIPIPIKAFRRVSEGVIPIIAISIRVKRKINRMPVILGSDDWAAWLGETAANDNQLKALLKPYPSERLAMWSV